MGIGEIVLLVCLGVLFAVLIIWYVIDSKNSKVVLEKSQMVKQLLELNKTMHFSRISSQYSEQQECNSKRQLDNLTMDQYLIALIDAKEYFYHSIVETISYNRREYPRYCLQVQRMQSKATEEYCRSFGYSLKKFLRWEKRVFRRKKLRKPQLNVTIHLKATYTSPQGRNHYWKQEQYDYDSLKRWYDYTIELKAQRQTRQYQIKLERAKMSDSLRYDILRRDNFRCQICGSSAQDGVKLHVDHIVPVSKGGKTTPDNLRTLCDRCNMGKSDKM